MANFNKTICKRRRVTIASRRAHRVNTTDDDTSDNVTTAGTGGKAARGGCGNRDDGQPPQRVGLEQLFGA
jgi:hypothetical protein